MKKNVKILKWAIFVIIASIALPVLATNGYTGPTTVQDIFDIVHKIVTYFWWFLLAMGVVMFIIAGINFMTAGGDPEKTKKAQNLLLYGVIGIAIGLSAKTLIVLIAYILGIDIPW